MRKVSDSAQINLGAVLNFPHIPFIFSYDDTLKSIFNPHSKESFGFGGKVARSNKGLSVHRVIKKVFTEYSVT